MDDPASFSFFLFSTETTVSLEMPDPIWSALNIILVIFLVLSNGFFVASEFALVAVRRSRIEAQAAEGSKAAERLLGMLNNLNAYISATQLGITLSSLGLGWVGEPAIARLIEPLLVWIGSATGATFLASGAVLHTVAFAIAFSTITFLHIVFGELAPKTAALEISEKVSYFIAVPLQVFYKIGYYPIRLLDWAGTKTAAMFGLQATGEHGASYSEDEIRHLVNASQEKGLLNEDERRLINQVFEFSETTVKEAMIPRTEIVAIPATSNVQTIIEQFQSNGYSRLPVYGESLDDIRGVIHSKDVLSYVFRQNDFRLEKVLQKPVYVVDTARLEDVLRRMQLEKFHFGFVVDEHGGIEGIITLEDLLEEIVGEISDEHDVEVSEQINELPDGTYMLDGGLAVRDLNRRLDMNLPVSESYTTLAGFLMYEAGELLETGDEVPFNGHIFRIESAEKRRILKVRMIKLEEVSIELEEKKEAA